MKKIILFILCLLVGLLFIVFGLNKFFNFIPVPKKMPDEMVKVYTAYMTIGWLMPLVGTFEVIGGALIILPRTRALGILVLIPILTGIVLANISTGPSALPLPLIIIAILGWAFADNWKKYVPLVAK